MFLLPEAVVTPGFRFINTHIVQPATDNSHDRVQKTSKELRCSIKSSGGPPGRRALTD